MKKELQKGLRTWIEIDKKAVKHNFSVFKNLIPKKCKILSVVKSNAYGHNFIEFSQEVEKLGTDFIGVDSIVEAIALRREGVKTPILVLGYTLPEMIPEAIDKDISISVSSFETLKEIKKLDCFAPLAKTEGMDSRLRGNGRGVRSDRKEKKLKIHIKVDTGMGRHGFLLEDVERMIKEIKKLILKNDKNHFGQGNIKVEGIFTHFSCAKDPNDRKYTEKQIENFKKWVEVFEKNNLNVIKHACATSGTILFPEAHFDMVRIGIGLYGIYPSDEIKKHFENKLKLKPVLSWKTIVGEIKKLPKGSLIGYDGTKKLERDSVIAVCPIGYWHGFPRDLSNKGEVLVRGKIAKVLGRVCMDIIMLDVTEIKGVKVGDEVTILGKNERKVIKIGDITGKNRGSNYELVTRINPLIKRFYI